ncbi:DNA polymerase III subunit delta [Fulvivirga lutea]|uniref:DNA polymerase III subunit delta n=1 Tax=Fulvivirga lutea TaxID=2810512 RepID=A0A975A0R1_9BACT|nr:DNA polymerase III subunit delta [Fulvivirga lutea]QSE96717.1 DNA polymerase III subunit delta [Fulvivirga lutea]
MSTTPEAVLSDLKSGKIAPVYFLQGEETFYIDQISDYIENNILTESEKGFNQTIVYGRDANVSTILNHARRFPMMSERQVVIVKEAQSISDINREEGSKMLLDYLNNPVPSTVLVFCHKNKTLDKRKALGKSIDKLSVNVVTKKIYDDKLPAWIESHVSSKGYKISHKAVRMLADSIGTNLERVSNEVDKIAINLSDGAEISEELVQKYVGISKDYNVFELQKALAAKDVLKANKIVNYFEANSKKNPIIPIVAVLFSFYGKLLIAVSQKDKSLNGVANALNMNSFFAKDFHQASGLYSLPQVVRNIHQLRLADLQLKGVNSTGSVSDGQILKELIFRLLH